MSTPALPRRIRIRWDAVFTAITALVVGVAIGIALTTAVTTAVNEDLHGGLPRCTDEIADAGGMCWGAIR